VATLTVHALEQL